jgi:glutaminase
LQLSSLEMNCESNSVLAATLANNGTCPITGERILKQEAVTNVLSLMYSCGMSIYSGQFAFQVIIPYPLCLRMFVRCKGNNEKH